MLDTEPGLLPWGRVMVIAPHADDETLGCGALLSRCAREGVETVVVVVTMQGGVDREAEMSAAAERLGVSKVHKVFTAARLPFVDDRVVDCLDEHVQAHEPEMLAIPFAGASHQEHRDVAGMGMSIARPVAWARRWRPYVVLGYEEVHDCFTSSPLAKQDLHVSVGEQDVDAKVEAMACHQSQGGDEYGARSERAIRSLAALRGAQVGLPWAEAYESLLHVV